MRDLHYAAQLTGFLSSRTMIKVDSRTIAELKGHIFYSVETYRDIEIFD